MSSKKTQFQIPMKPVLQPRVRGLFRLPNYSSLWRSAIRLRARATPLVPSTPPLTWILLVGFALDSHESNDEGYYCWPVWPETDQSGRMADGSQNQIPGLTGGRTMSL